MKTLLSLCLAAATLAATPALGDCLGSKTLDRCLVGTWKMTGGGAAAWMGHNIHSAHITAMSANGVTLVVRGDGTFSTGDVDVHTAVAADNGHLTGTGHATGSASGQWSVSGRNLNFCAAGASFHQTVTVVVNGKPITVTPNSAPRPTAMAYTCNASTMTTTHVMPHLEPIVTTYSRSH